MMNEMMGSFPGNEAADAFCAELTTALGYKTKCEKLVVNGEKTDWVRVAVFAERASGNKKALAEAEIFRKGWDAATKSAFETEWLKTTRRLEVVSP